MPLEPEFQKLYDEMDRSHVSPLWRASESIIPWQPQPRAVPWLWKWSQLFFLARRSGELVTIERGGDRRALGLCNPGLGGAPYVTSTLWAAVQWLNGREVAPAHCHSAQAVRFVIDGKGAYSTVQGDKIYLERGDFAINPPGYWHDHGSEGDSPTIWMDALDVPLNNYLDASFFERAESDQQEVTAVIDASILKYGFGQLRPAWEEPCRKYSPISTYKWSTTERALMNLAKVSASPFDDVALEYTNPHTGRPVMDTMTAWIQMLRPGVHTKAHRQVNSAVYHVFEGRGATVIGGVRFDWEQGDIFVIPSWTYHEHINESKTERAILFSVQDTPVLVALGKYREEALTANGGFQIVKESFAADKVPA
ncbi:MAG: cupin domain-containing protein [Candidatus Acidiferrales bacterium]